MSTLNKHISIPKDMSSKDDLDFHFLREEGIRYIKELGSNFWTDYNTHDPGITMLEVLCYAISDLGNRINIPIEDLIANEEGGVKGQFYKVQEILPSAPTSELDLRKLFIDIEGIKNCWIKRERVTVFADLKNQKLSYEKTIWEDLKENQKAQFDLKGLYRILVETEDADKVLSESLEKAVFTKFHANRNLCEDLIKVEKVATEPISVCANVEVAPEADEELIHAQILIAIEDYLAPSPRHYSLKQMVDKGYTMDEIFEGPFLENGFIDTVELKASELRKEVRLSDIINIIMSIDGVKIVKEITLGNCDENDGIENNQWVICIPENKKPKLCKKTTINYFKGILPINLNPVRVDNHKSKILASRLENDLKAKDDLEPAIPQGTFADWGEYSSIQHEFPETYGISDIGLPPKLGVKRAVLARQLKGYLLFFDQILASYFEHLSKIKSLLSLDQGPSFTYFTQAIKDIKDVEELFKDPTLLENDEELTKSLIGKLDDTIERRNQLMDHLIARFAENFSSYAFLMKFLYGESTDEIVLQDKQSFLREYKEISRERGEGFNFYEQSNDNLWDTLNVSGAQKRISKLVGVKDYSRRNLSDTAVEIYRYEHVDGNWVYRWRIRDENGKVLLSATTSYPTYNSAGNEMYFAILKILETPLSDLEKLLEVNFRNENEAGSFHFHKAATSNKFSFDIINPVIDSESSSDFIVAKQYTYYPDRTQAVLGAISLLNFIKYTFTEEGIYLVEHILLRPSPLDPEYLAMQTDAGKEYIEGNFLPFCSDDYENCKMIDPYSFRVSIVLPGFTYRFANKDFRDYLENLIREELPAHIVAKICWIGYRKGEEPELFQEDVENPETPIFKENQLEIFEKAYKNYLFELTDIHKRKGFIASMNKYNQVLNEMTSSLTGLHTIYPTGRLYDCEDEEEELDGKLILGKTNLGTL
ncbi:hypothetical protein [Algoriphagus machipongonensis]|uniref:Uncharacterized protein n=1 Tax=Algoriphagus machipongonensis TaxID=388413 RepID=A3HTB3_9BACT|nr:hypothetical protein [Algoriphagus machipongonensis]7AEB_A Chain A, baseplate protein (Algo12) [Algoriphagus machipongonensis]7AEB_B Chain B, baseplate protein (Algo12) [Algoriphagus machipongonensis]7AEB_C Chain C, baseplate protein (Algo12) [Algoriphagus machipongonensis]7AEB_D Chain D, baseplate protein (Algo12) [Algoriphagus machipongonensis]7AEB_E Chain E, baseplate protein (Algo12) [Algoriphagus machipongonensis]7AEB_F Chain F, baseplate protein (Algo12) [Algoriphagus machipongonensi